MISLLLAACLAQLDQPPNTWVKRTPLEGTPVSPRMGYEGDCVWVPKHRVLLRYGGHNQGGGGEQGSEVWTLDPFTARWALKEPNTSPPGVCCVQMNVCDPAQARYLRFPSFSASHGWQWHREIYLNNTSVWSYDLETNLWRNLRPLPTASPSPLRCASWDSDQEVVVMFGGEGNREGTVVYDPYLNTWTSMKPALQPEFRSGGQMVYDAARKVHILFGSQFSKDEHTWAYDLGKNEWRDLKPPSMPPTEQNDAVLAYDSVNRVVLAIVRVAERLQTWTYDAGRNEWKKMDPPREPDPSGSRARDLTFVPELNLAILENCAAKPREQQIWTWRTAEGKPEAATPARVRAQPRIVEDVVVSVLAEREVEVSWKAAEGVSYHVERAPVEVASEDQLKMLKSRTAPLDDPSVGAIRRVGAFRRLTGTPLRAGPWVDRTVDLSKPAMIEGPPLFERTFSKEAFDPEGKACGRGVYAYRVRAVNGAGVESGPSAAVFTIPSAPRWVFSKEEAGACRLKWAANPEKGIKGYRVYRMDGRWDKDKVSRLTAEPVAELGHVDGGAGKSTRRYYVVAIDAIGQEGHPSSPVWHEREWKQYYKPFTGEWHQ